MLIRYKRPFQGPRVHIDTGDIRDEDEGYAHRLISQGFAEAVDKDGKAIKAKFKLEALNDAPWEPPEDAIAREKEETAALEQASRQRGLSRKRAEAVPV